MSNEIGALQENMPAPASGWASMFAWNKPGVSHRLEHSKPPAALTYMLCFIAILVLIGLKAMSNVPCDRLQSVAVSLAKTQQASTEAFGIGTVNCMDPVRVGQIITDGEKTFPVEINRQRAGTVTERTYGSTRCLIKISIQSSALLYEMQASPSRAALVDIHVEHFTLGDTMFALFKHLNGKKGH